MEKKKFSLNDFITQANAQNTSLIEFDNCIFETGLSLLFNDKHSFYKTISFKNCEFSKIEFQHCTFKGTVYLHNCIVKEHLSITVCEFEARFITTGLNANRISIWNNNFKSRFDMIRYHCLTDAIFQFNLNNGDIHIEQERASLKNKLTDIQFEKTPDHSLTISELHSNSIHFKFPAKHFNNGVVIHRLEADELQMFFLNNKADNKIVLDSIAASKIVLSNFHNDGLFMINNLISKDKEHSIFDIHSSYLGNCELYNVDFASFQKIQFYDCHLQDIIPVNVKWNFNFNAYSGINEEYIKELFRQFKIICANSMDKISQLRFEQLEMQYYTKQLHWRRNFGDWIILQTNRYSNQYGQNWVLPLLWLLAISFLLFTIVNYCDGSFECYHLGNYFSFLTPFHSLSEILCYQGNHVRNNWVVFWDVWQKILSSYFIFQFLRAFRKYVT